MTEAAETSGGDMVDVAFSLEGTQLPADYALALWDAVLGELPWLAEDARAGIHTLKAVDTNYSVVLLPNAPGSPSGYPRRARMPPWPWPEKCWILADVRSA
jgi:hypothetical protein